LISITFVGWISLLIGFYFLLNSIAIDVDITEL